MNARRDHSSRFAGPLGIGGCDYLTSPTHRFVVARHATALDVNVRCKAFAHNPFAKVEAVPQHKSHHLLRRSSRVPSQTTKALLLCRCER